MSTSIPVDVESLAGMLSLFQGGKHIHELRLKFYSRL